MAADPPALPFANARARLCPRSTLQVCAPHKRSARSCRDRPCEAASTPSLGAAPPGGGPRPCVCAIAAQGAAPTPWQGHLGADYPNADGSQGAARGGGAKPNAEPATAGAHAPLTRELSRHARRCLACLQRLQHGVALELLSIQVIEERARAPAARAEDLSEPTATAA